MRALLHQRQPALELTADAIATMVTERRIEEILERAEEADNNEDNNVTGTLEVALYHAGHCSHRPLRVRGSGSADEEAAGVLHVPQQQ